MSKRNKAAQPANAGPEVILPLTDFREDPWGTGDKKAVAFRAGILSSPVPAEFARRMRDEGKAVDQGSPLKLSEEEQAMLPPLDPDAVDSPADRILSTGR